MPVPNLKRYFRLNDDSLQNLKNFPTCEPFKFQTEKFSNANLFRQISSQNLRHGNLGFSETDDTENSSKAFLKFHFPTLQLLGDF